MGVGLVLTAWGALGAGCSGGGARTGKRAAPLVGGQADATARGVVAVVGNREACSGSLIAPNLVLTARHCVAAFAGAAQTVSCATTTFVAADAAATFTIVVADDFRGGNPPASARLAATAVRTPPAAGVCGNDVALIVLASKVAAATATPIVPRLDMAPQTNEAFDAVGYGVTDPADTTGTTYGLRRRAGGLRVRCVGTACGSAGIAASEWVADTPVCNGDSGGPALDTAGRVMGVASRSDGVCSMGLYADVSAWKSFIVAAAMEAATAGGYAPPPWVAAASDAGVATDAATASDGAAARDTAAGGDTAPGADAGTLPPDAGSASDAAPARDAGGGTGGTTGGAPDGATTGPEAGGSLGATGDGGGCACAATGAGGDPTPAVLVLGLVLGLRRARRRPAPPIARPSDATAPEPAAARPAIAGNRKAIANSSVRITHEIARSHADIMPPT